jgi:formylglycine-generating enzyme required for sulfatase activity
VPEPEPTPAPAKRTRRTTPRPAAAAPAPAPERPSAFSRFLSSAWSWGAAAVTIGASVWQLGGFNAADVGVVLPPAAGASAPVVVASGVVMPRSAAILVASAPKIGVAVPRAAVASAPASVATELTVGQRFRDCDDDSCPWMIVLPAGSFLMGSPESEPGRLDREGPQHRVQVASFAMGQYEVTFRQWDACVAAGGCEHNPGDEGWGRGQRPVIYVSWDDAQQYAKWLSGKTGQTYRLPSEAEWEYAARAGTTTPFAFGERITTAQANFDGNYTYNGSAKGELRAKTLPVGSLAKDAWDLYDLHGNVWEWVQDCWHDNYQGAPDSGRAWVSGCSGEIRRVLRGGSWINDPVINRSAFRIRFTPDDRYYSTGFRLARTLTH